ncbi:phospho-N-acetylmuramoyl-pentapeptide-transferase [Oceanirhabdus sp. W0125-5]|uniref:phospho-N-acetylmuramoyl-pentapeptide- transferase n=1 Tax=Oceanirhabdus sp. W0125-5 TaxID=2999116 RepID=UPI0022F2FFDB|nr:phospho-N-acetylmuramoyl-pentapeptide-transferase [Oceanirhabdus sp. W0125-5]WBW95353.1 phospho-N-acetylmuramoyl-pentapeptide-transferase [Oceanirhabdus sp. W0125-5]
MSKIIYAVILSTIITLVITPFILKLLIKLKTGQNIREEGPRSHFTKAGTPSMGGLIFIIATILTFFLVAGWETFFSGESLLVMISFLCFGFIGFLDDYLKIVKKVNEGLKSKQKFVLQIFFGLIIGVLAMRILGSTEIMIPFTGIYVDLKWLYVPFIIIYMTATTNATNLTDGIDGLLTSVSILVITFFALVCYSFSNYPLAIFCGILAGALLGFLRVNSYPASVFMGDTGSLAIGGAIGAVALILKIELIVLIVGGIYVLEALSVIIQVGVYKKTKKRVFKMAPLHHHFEELGWHENKVVSMFSIITVILCLLGFLAITFNV